MRVFDTFRQQLGEQQRYLFLNGIDHMRIYRLRLMDETKQIILKAD
jgi:hypothetical protein